MRSPSRLRAGCGVERGGTAPMPIRVHGTVHRPWSTWNGADPLSTSLERREGQEKKQAYRGPQKSQLPDRNHDRSKDTSIQRRGSQSTCRFLFVLHEGIKNQVPDTLLRPGIDHRPEQRKGCDVRH
jgi:hypothetical protein